MTWLNLVNLVALVVLVSSCSGKSDNRLLRLPGEQLTKSELRDRWRDQLTQSPAAAAVICGAIADAELDAVLSFFETDVSSKNLTESQVADLRRAARIIQEECEESPGPNEPG